MTGKTIAHPKLFSNVPQSQLKSDTHNGPVGPHPPRACAHIPPKISAVLPRMRCARASTRESTRPPKKPRISVARPIAAGREFGVRA